MLGQVRVDGDTAQTLTNVQVLECLKRMPSRMPRSIVRRRLWHVQRDIKVRQHANKLELIKSFPFAINNDSPEQL
jgi:hypothetical protein